MQIRKRRVRVEILARCARAVCTLSDRVCSRGTVYPTPYSAWLEMPRRAVPSVSVCSTLESIHTACAWRCPCVDMCVRVCFYVLWTIVHVYFRRGVGSRSLGLALRFLPSRPPAAPGAAPGRAHGRPGVARSPASTFVFIHVMRNRSIFCKTSVRSRRRTPIPRRAQWTLL